MAKYGFTWAVSTCTLIAALLSAIGFFIHIVGFSCPEWWVGPGEERSPFISIGWHQACFEDCRFPYCPGGDYGTVYDGCYRWTFNEWLWDDERIRELREWFLPDWFKLNMNIIIIGLPLGGCAAALLILCTCFTMDDRYTTSDRDSKDTITLLLLYLVSILLIAAGVICVVGLTMFSVQTSRLDWMPMPEKNSFGYSFWMVVVSTILYFAAFVFCLGAGVSKTIRLGIRKDPRYSEEMMLGKA